MPLSKTFFSTFPGLNTSDSRYRLPEGSFTKALNVTIIKQDMVEPRHGMPPWDVFRYDENAPLRYELANYAPRTVTIEDFSQVGPDFFITIDNPGWNQGDTIALEALAGDLPTGFPPVGGVQVGPKIGTNKYQLINMTSIAATAGSKYLITSRNNHENVMQNMFYWRNGVVERYIVMSKNSTQYGTSDLWTTYLIDPPDYFNPAEVARYNKIRESYIDRTIEVPFSYPRYIESNKGLYISEPTKWICLRKPTFPTITPEFIKQDSPIITDTSVEDDVANNWLNPGYAVKVKLVSNQILDDGAELEGRPTDAVEIANNSGVPQIVAVAYKVTTNMDSVLIYRTKQYQISGPTIVKDGVTIPFASVPEVDYRLAATSTAATLVPGVTYRTSLTFGDGIVGTAGDLYTNLYKEGDVGGNMDMPACGDAYVYKGHTFFSDTLTLPQTFFSILSLQATAGSPSTPALAGHTVEFSYSVFGVDYPLTLAFRNQPYPSSPFGAPVIVATNPSPTLGGGYGLFDEGQYVAPGASGTANTGLIVTIVPYNAVTKKGDVVPNGTSGNKPAIVANDLDIVSVDVDFSKFNVVGGGFLFVSGLDVVNTVSLISYASVEKTPTGIKFKTVKVVGGDTMLATSAEDIAIYYIPGTTIKNLPLYLGSGALSGDFTLGDGTRSPYFSLLPSRRRPDTVVASVNTLAIGSVTAASGGNYMTASAEPRGATDRGNSQLIQATAESLARAINLYGGGSLTARIAEGVGQISITGDTYGLIKARVPDVPDPDNPGLFLDSIGGKFNPSLTNTFQTLSNPAKERSKNGVIVAKQGVPEQVPFSSYTVPQPVGNSQNRIRRMASLKDQIYFFKENEGIYTCDADAGNGEFGEAFFKAISPLDLTIKLIAPESLQSIDEQLIFLSNKGFARLQYGRVDLISVPIDIEVKINSARCPNLELVSSYVDPVKRLYICNIPDTTIEGTGVTYVYNLNSSQWTTSDVEFNWGVTDNIGRASLICTDYRIKDDPTNQRSLDTSDKIRPKQLLAQYLRQESLTGRELEGIVTNDFDPVISNPGEELIVLRQAVNISNSAFDQYDEKIVGFSNITINGLTSVTLTRTSLQQGLKRDYSLRWWTQRLKGKKLFLKTFWNGLGDENIPVTLLDSGETATENFITVSLPPKTTSMAINTSTDQILVGVNAVMEIAPFYFQAPQFLKQWSEGQFHFQNRLEPQSLPIILNVSYAVDDQAGWTKVTSIDRRLLVSGIYRALIPLEATRGRYLRIKVEHNIPENYFQFQGVTLSIRNTSSVKSVQVS